MVAPDSARGRSDRLTIEWAVVAALAVVALVLGYVGFADVYERRGYGWTELLYRSIQLFVLQSGAVDQDVPLVLDIARWLAPAVAGYAAIRALILLFREHLGLLGLRWFAKDHTVLVGLGDKGFALAKALRSGGHRVVVVERAADSPYAAGCRERGIAVVVGDASDEQVLLKANVQRARHLAVTAGDDLANIAIGLGATKLCYSASRRVSSVFVHVDDLALWRLIQPRILALRARLPIRIEFFNVAREAALALLDQHPPVHAHGPQHVLVVGPSALCESVILHLARTRLADGGERLKITIAGAAPGSQRDELLARFHALGRICELEARDLVSESLDRLGPPVTAAYVCLDDEPAGLAAALVLSSHPATRGVPIVLAVKDETTGAASVLREDSGLGRIRPFGVLSRTLDANLLERGANEILARAKHEHYLQCERERGVTAAENPSIVPWEQLDESLKESNRLFADSIGAKLEASGCTVVPAPLADPAAPGFAFSTDELEELARAEHDRWCSDLEREGWRWGAEKDPARKLHPDLVPWSELSEDARDKDREPVRALPQMLARVGFEIERSDGLEPGPAEVAALADLGRTVTTD